MLRLFAALALPDAIADPLRSLQQDLAGASWRPREALHITLRFFGEVQERVADDLHLELSQIASTPLDLCLSGLGSFGEGADLNAVWAGVAPSTPLNRLAQACDLASQRVGLRRDGRRYIPHVTLAYLRRTPPQAVARWMSNCGPVTSSSFQVGQFGLYSSQLAPSGSHYQLEQVYRLTA